MNEVKISAMGGDVVLVKDGKEAFRLTRKQYRSLTEEERDNIFEVLTQGRLLPFKKEESFNK